MAITLSADNRLRQKVSEVDGTVILVGAGNVDRCIRFTKLPDCLKPFMTKYHVDTEGGGSAEKTKFPVMLNLDRGPDQEAWAEAKRQANFGARRDKPMPEALPVSAKNEEGWALDFEDIPVIEFEESEKAKPVEFKCSTCTSEFRTEHALKIHQGRTKHD